jgi:alpha-tubulin suppressor-like RCC1 family protein
MYYTISAGTYHTCALLFDGTARCWGSNTVGQLGDGSQTDSNVAVVVTELSNVRSASAGYFYTCATLETGTLLCWGANGFGMLGDGTTSDRYVPTNVTCREWWGACGGRCSRPQSFAC